MTDILLVEDEESVNRGIEFTLTKEGYQVETAGTIREAEIVLEEDHPRMVICDLNLPDGSGLDLIRRIRESAQRLTSGIHPQSAPSTRQRIPSWTEVR